MSKKEVSVTKYMYRYLLKYVGTYRVKAEYDLEKQDFPRTELGTIDPSFEDLYISCSRGCVIKHTYIDKDILVLCFYDKVRTARNVFEELKKKYPAINISYEELDADGFIYFNANDIKKVATIVKPKTSGKDISPFSSKNLPKADYKIPSKDLSELYELTKDMDRIDTLHFFKSVNSEFMSKQTKKLQEAKKSSRLATKEFIHSSGLWDKYIRFVRKHLE